MDLKENNRLVNSKQFRVNCLLVVDKGLIKQHFLVLVLIQHSEQNKTSKQTKKIG